MKKHPHLRSSRRTAALIVCLTLAVLPVAAQSTTGTIAGIAVDAASRGLIGAGGFSKTLTAYLIYVAATRVNLENALLRIPVLAAATLIDSAIYVFWVRSLGYTPSVPFMQTMSYRLIGTTIVGTLAFYLLDSLFSERARQRRTFASRRKGARRGASTLKRR